MPVALFDGWRRSYFVRHRHGSIMKQTSTHLLWLTWWTSSLSHLHLLTRSSGHLVGNHNRGSPLPKTKTCTSPFSSRHRASEAWKACRRWDSWRDLEYVNAMLEWNSFTETNNDRTDYCTSCTTPTSAFLLRPLLPLYLLMLIKIQENNIEKVDPFARFTTTEYDIFEGRYLNKYIVSNPFQDGAKTHQNRLLSRWKSKIASARGNWLSQTMCGKPSERGKVSFYWSYHINALLRTALSADWIASYKFGNPFAIEMLEGILSVYTEHSQSMTIAFVRC